MAASSDGDVVDGAALCADVVRAFASRWRTRLEADGRASRGDVQALVERMETAAALLDPARDAPEAPAPDEDLFRLYVQNTNECSVLLLRPDGRIAGGSAGALRLEGYRPEELVGESFSILFDPEDAARGEPRRVLERAAAKGHHEEERWRVRKGGSRFWARVGLRALRDEAGALRGFAEVARAHGDGPPSDEALRQSEERFRLMVAAVRDYAIFMLDPEGRISSWNAGAEHLKGYRADEIIGCHFSIFYTEADRLREHPAWELEQAKAEGRYAEEGFRVRKDGSMFWASVTITALFEPDGRHVGFAKVTRDMTERRQMEQSLREMGEALERRVRERTAEIEAKREELEAFSYSVSHDLRAPLRSLDGFSRLLLEHASERLKPQEKDYLERIRKAAQRMSQLIDALLSLARLTNAPLVRQRADVSEIARATAEELRQASPERRVDLAVEDGLKAEADPQLLRVLLANLLSNAWKFTQNKPEAHIEVGETREAGLPVFFVRDDGVGFDPAKADKLFSPFHRMHKAKDFEGTGIGLATARRIVQRHGGRIWAEARPGAGATFYFTLEPPPEPR